MATWASRQIVICIAVALVGLSAMRSARAEESAGPATVDFARDVAPIFTAHCLECHGADLQESDFRLDRGDSALRGGANGAAIVPGKSGESSLVERVVSLDPDRRMPPEGDRLSAERVTTLRKWIDQGANWPKDSGPAADAKSQHWSLLPLVKPQVPTTTAADATAAKLNPIDAFVLAKLAEHKLRNSPEADRRTLIRRVTIDLTGLQPTPEDVAAFLADTSAEAYERVVDRLLASPRYGERWARHWMDVAHFAETHGNDQDRPRPNAWPYRDYLIRAFNDDKPYAQFVSEQVAGDVLYRDDPQATVALGFLAAGSWDESSLMCIVDDTIDKKLAQVLDRDDMITNCMSTFTSTTVHCARCHNHKFDPIPTEDYYRLRAAFEGVTHGERVLASDEQRKTYAEKAGPLEKRRTELTREKDALEKSIATRALQRAAEHGAYPLPVVTRHFNEHRFAPVSARYLKFKILGTSDRPQSGRSARIDEFEAWTATENAALASYGTKAEGATSARAEDIAGGSTYGVNLVNDGKFGERWFVGNPPELTLTFPRAETIQRIVFSQDRTAAPDNPGVGIGPFVTEYQALISSDGKQWQLIADSGDRKPFNEAHTIARFSPEVSSEDEKLRLQTLTAELAQLNQQISAIPPLPLVWAGKFDQPKETTYVHKSGDPQRRGADVIPASLAVLDQVTKPYALSADAPDAERRLSLANWIASDANPLTVRVLANRVWHYHFGTGIVDTPSDFGYLGGKPSHPELLDWLARRLQQHGWRLKPLHREILLSQTYRQSSDAREDAAKLDASARLLWRFPARRLSAEEIRDSILAVTGKLDLKMGGPGFRLYRYLQDNVATYIPLDQHGPETYRRAVYHQNARASLLDGLTDFDLPDSAYSAPSRISTTSPLQALTLLNHRFTLDMSDALAERAKREAPNDQSAQVRRAFALAFQRTPEPEEEQAALKLIGSHGWRAFCRALLNANELIYLN